MTDYRQMGIAALIPGLQIAHEQLGRQLDELRAELAALQAGEAPAKRGRLKEPKGSGPAGYWAKLSPAQRSAEMKRRQAAAKAKGGGRWPKADVAKLHPRDPRSPRHEEWLEKMRKVMRKRWEGMSAKERKQRSDALKRGRAKQAATAREAVNEARAAKANGAAA